MDEPVAIVGIAALLPGSPSLAEFWRTVVSGRDLMTDVPASRWLVEDHYDPDPRAVDKTYGRRGAFLPEVDFDPLRYGIPPNNLPAIDTSQLLALTVAEQVLADCVGRPADPERVSVLIGSSGMERIVEAAARLQRPVWQRALREHGVADDLARSICDRIAAHYVPWQEETFPGLLTNVVAGRIANRFDLHGLNHTTDAACASSLAALYSGIAELRLGRSDVVITGGVDTMNDVTMYACFTRTPALSPTDDCRPFAADADGTMLGEGLVMFALKRLADAEGDGDRVYAVVRGIGASSDGRGGAIYAPVPAGQARALRRAYAAAGYGPETVELVEAHGTGTSAGDIAEFSALREVFGTSGELASRTGQLGGQADRQWCALGSVKSQIGHTKAAAGAVGLLKAVLALHQKVLPPTIKVDRPHPALEIESSPFYLNTAARPWIRPTAAHPRRASVSSFGFGGTNFHVTVEEYPGGRPARMPAAPTELVLLSAGSVAELRDRVQGLFAPEGIGAEGTVASGGMAGIARRSQAEFQPGAEVRLAVVATEVDDLAEALRRVEAGQPLLRGHYATGAASPGKLGFLFPGQGAQYAGMGADLATHLDRARVSWDRSAGLDLGDRPLHRVVFPPPAFTEEQRADQERRLTATEWAQPALAVHSLALLGVLDAVGIAADCVAGHSLGELVALHAAGAYDADALVRLARRRGELMAGQPARGGMLVVAADRDTVAAAIAGRPDVWLANHNAPEQVVLAGTRPALDAAADLLAAEGITCTRLNATTAFHSPLVAPAREPLLAYLRGVEVSAPRLPVFGTAGGHAYPANPDAVRERLAAQLAEPVAFVDVVEAMYAAGVRTFVEVGAGTALTGLVGRILGDRPHAAVGLDRRGRQGLTSLQEGLGRLAVHGVSMDLGALWTETVLPDVVPVQRSRSTVRLDGGNFGRPYPPAAGGHLPPPPQVPPVPAPTPAVPAPAPAGHVPPLPATADPPATPVAVDGGWLRAIEDAQRQLAEAHGAFQRTMAESHTAYLRMAETTLAGLLGTATGETPAVPARPAAPSIPAAPPPVPSDPGAPPIPAAPPAGPSSPGEVAAVPMPRAPDLTVPSPPRPAGQPNLPAAVPATRQPPAAVPEPAAPPEQPRDAGDVGALLLSVVAERTGFPVEILDVDMALDTDLGIDSIKKVEILSAVRDRVGAVPGGELPSLATLRTVREIADRITGRRAHPAAPGLIRDLRQDPPDEALADGPATELVRRTLSPVVAPPGGRPMAGLAGRRLVVTDDGGGVAALVAAGLGRHGIAAEIVTQVPADADSVILLDGLRAVASVDTAIQAQRAALQSARAVAARMEAGGGAFVTVQDTGGDFGLATPADPARAWLGGLAALARTAAREWPRAAVKAIDCAATGRQAAAVAEAIVAELVSGGEAGEVGLRADGARVVPELREAPVDAAGSRIGPHSVVVATGGARGVTAAALRLLAGRHRPRLVLLGRTPLASADEDIEGVPEAADEAAVVRLLARHRPAPPAELAARARQVLAAREVRDTLAAFAHDGVPARYLSVDVRDPEPVRRALEAVRTDWGPVTAIVHGAGVLADARIRDKTDEQVARVFDTKVGGLRALLAATADDPVEVLCAFSSAAAVFGNAGQADYAMANEVMGQVLAAERARRPDCLVRAIAWGPWLGGMVTPELAGRFRDRGVPLIDPDAGARAFLAELAGQADGVLAILAPPSHTEAIPAPRADTEAIPAPRAHADRSAGS